MEGKEQVVDAAVDAGLLPILDGLNKMAEETTKTRKSVESKVEQFGKDYDRKIEDLEGRMNKSVEDLLARQNRLKDQSSLLGRALLDIQPSDDGLISVIPDRVKKMAPLYEHFAAAQPKQSSLSAPRVAMAVAEWFRTTTRISLPRVFASSMREDADTRDKLFVALQEKHFGADHEAFTALIKAAYAEDAAGTGGNLVPTIVEADIIRLIKDSGDIFPLGRQITMTKKVHQMPAENTAVTVNWIDEAGTLTGGEGTFAQKTLTAEKIAGRATLSMEMIQDSSPGVLSYLLEVFSEKIAGELDFQMVLGDGSGPQFTGIRNGVGINVVTSSATAAGRNLTYPLMVNTFVGASEKSTRLNGYWYVSPKGYAVVLGLVDTTGQPIVKFADVESAPNGTFLGRPIIVSGRLGGATNLDDVTNVNTTILFGPVTALLCGTRMGLGWDVTDQVNWAKHQVDCRLIGRFAGNVGIPSAFSRLTKVNYT